MTITVHHDHDFYSWAMRNAQLLREGQFAAGVRDLVATGAVVGAAARSTAGCGA